MGTLLKPEFLLLLLIAFVFFGAKRLPEAGSAIGKTIREFQKSMREVSEPEQPTPSAAIPPAAPAPQQLATATPATPSAAEAASAEPTTTRPPAQ